MAYFGSYVYLMKEENLGEFKYKENDRLKYSGKVYEIIAITGDLTGAIYSLKGNNENLSVSTDWVDGSSKWEKV